MNENIMLTEKRYSRTDSGKSWRSNPDTAETREIDARQHENITNDETLKWFRRLGGSEHATYGYTSQGYKVVRLSSCNPDRSLKVVREFDFEN